MMMNQPPTNIMKPSFRGSDSATGHPFLRSYHAQYIEDFVNHVFTLLGTVYYCYAALWRVRHVRRIDHDLDYLDPHVGQIDHDLDRLNLNSQYDILCRICIVQIQPRKHVLRTAAVVVVDHADYSAPTRQHDHAEDNHNVSALKYLDHQVGIDDLSDDLPDVCNPLPVRCFISAADVDMLHFHNTWYLVSGSST